MENLAFTLDIIGKIMIAYTALSVHSYVSKERGIDRAVFRAMRREKVIGISGIIFMVAGYLIHIVT